MTQQGRRREGKGLISVVIMKIPLLQTDALCLSAAECQTNITNFDSPKTYLCYIIPFAVKILFEDNFVNN